MQERRIATPHSASGNATRFLPPISLASKLSLPILIVLTLFYVKLQSNYSDFLNGRESLQRDFQSFSTDVLQASNLHNNLASIRANLYRVSVWSIAGVNQSNRDEGARVIETALDSIDEIVSVFESSGFNGIEKVRVLFDDYAARVRNALSLTYNNAFAGATATRDLDALHATLVTAAESFISSASRTIRQRTISADHEASQAVRQFIYMSIGLLSVVVILTLIVYIYVTRPIRQLVECIVSLEKGAENVTVPHCDRSDEIGHIARALKSFSATLEDRRELEQQIYEQKEEALRLASEAEAVSAAKTSFLANMSHEIRTPMNSILGMAELLRETKLTKKQQFFATTIFNSSAALLKIINDILDFSKIEAGKLQLDPVPFSPERAIRDVVDLIGPSAQEKGLEVTVKCDSDTPETVLGDAGRIRQVLTNLIGNAVKFTNKGYVRIDLKCMYSRDHAILRFDVADSGIGIETGKLANIFDDFTQAESSTTRNYGGTGLGLSITRTLIEAMGGRIGVISQSGEGSTFWFELELPVVYAIEPEPVDEPAVMESDEDDPAPSKEICDEKPYKILIADDNQLNRLLLKNMLDMRQYELHYAQNGQIAADMARKNQFDVILMDISMPVLDGIAATRLIRDHELGNSLSSVPIIALTAHIIPSDQKKYAEAGFGGFLPKPLRKADLLTAIEKSIGREDVATHITA